MIVKIFGALDLLAGIFLVLLKWGIGIKIGLILAIILGIKGLIFFYNWASVIDLVCVLFLVLAVYGFYFSFSWLFALWLFQKAFFSFFS